MASDTYHEPLELTSEPTRDLHRAITSLMEELEAVDWYHQRAGATQDLELRTVLEHNRDEEIEHAMMVLEWIRRNHPVFDVNIRKYLMKQGSITGIEAAAADKDAAGDPEPCPAVKSPLAGAPRSVDGSLGIGSLQGT